MYQGNAKEEDKNEDPFFFSTDEIDFVLLTHAHIDHSGRLPKLYKEGYRNPIIATKATCDLCAIMLPDSGHIQEMESEWKNRKRKRQAKAPIVPMYTAQEAARSLEIFKPVSYDEIIEIDENIKARFNDAGHMLGSSIIEVWVKEDGQEKKIVFSGDIGNNDIPLLDSPTMIETADYLVMESTYGGRLHLKNDDKAEMFLDIVSETLKHGGNVIIPSFAVGRTQEILYELNKLKEKRDDEEFTKKFQMLMKAPVYVDSPLAISATEVFKENEDLFEEEVKREMERGDNPLEFPGLQFTRTADESKALNESKIPSIIISASGMCEVGRIKHHLKHNLWDPKNTILFVGYQAPGTLGRRIVEGEKTVKIFGEDIAVNARVEYIEGFSGHADQEWLLNFIYSFITKPKHIFLVHGEEDQQLILKNKIIDTIGIPVTIPEFGEVYTLKEDLTVENVPIKPKELPIGQEIMQRIQDLKQELDRIEDQIKIDIQEDTKDEQIRQMSEKIWKIQENINHLLDE